MENLINKKIEEFSAPVYLNEEFVNLTDKDLKDKWSIMFFYPGDFTFVCPTELEDLADNYEGFKKEGCEIYAISTDSEFAHKEWHEKSKAISKVQFPLVSDRNFKLSKFFGVLLEDEGQSLRGTFIINPELEIVSYEVNALGIGRNAKELLRKLQAAKFVYEHGNQVCPANWAPGEATLTPDIDLVGKI